MSEDYRLQYLQMDATPGLMSHEKGSYSGQLKEHLRNGNENKIAIVFFTLNYNEMQAGSYAPATPVKCVLFFQV